MCSISHDTTHDNRVCERRRKVTHRAPQQLIIKLAGRLRAILGKFREVVYLPSCVLANHPHRNQICVQVCADEEVHSDLIASKVQSSQRRNYADGCVHKSVCRRRDPQQYDSIRDQSSQRIKSCRWMLDLCAKVCVQTKRSAETR